MISVEALVKPLDYQKKLNWYFASTLTEADSEPSQTSKRKVFAEIFNCFKLLTIFITKCSETWLWKRFK